MSFENLTDQLAIFRRQDLTSTEKLVAVVLLSFRNAETGRCDPPIVSDNPEKETICTRSGYTKQCITKAIASLEAKGVIAVQKRVAKSSEITFTVNDVYGKQGLPSTTITATVNDVYGKGKRRLPITDKEQIKNRQEYFSRENRFGDGDADLHGGAEVHPLCDPKPLCDFGGEVYPENGGVSEPDLFGGETFGPDYADQTPAPKHAENRLNPLISKGNAVAAAMSRNPADDDCKNADNPLNQKENGDADTPVRTKETKADPIPYAKIVALYNEKCVPPLPRAMNPSEQLKKNIRARCKDLKTIKGVKTVGELLEEFGKLFDMVAQSDWLCGRNGGWGKCNFPWLMQREKFENTINGLYSNRSARSELPDHLNPRIRFDKAYYEQEDPFNPDGSLNWKRKPTK